MILFLFLTLLYHLCSFSQRGSLDQILYTAILENKVDFVRLLLENPAVHLKEFTTVERLLHLYNDVPKECILFKLLDGYRAKPTVRT